MVFGGSVGVAVLGFFRLSCGFVFVEYCLHACGIDIGEYVGVMLPSFGLQAWEGGTHIFDGCCIVLPEQL